jgi:putative protease
MEKREKHAIEIMAPVGSYEALMAAIQGGADAVYFGIGQLNMRSRSTVNFSLDDLAEISRLCNTNRIKSYLTLNTIIYDNEIIEIKSILTAAKKHGISAIIASDWAVIQEAQKIGVDVHISTQCNITNIEAVRFFSRFADVMVTARELNLKQVANIVEKLKKKTSLDLPVI